MYRRTWFFIYAAYQVFFKKRKIAASVVVIIISGYLLFNIKAYIFLCLLPPFLLWLFLDFNKKIKDKTLRTAAKVFMTIASVFAGFFLVQQITSIEAANSFSTDNLFDSIAMQQKSFSYFEGTGSNFEVSKFDNSFVGLLLLFPQGIVNTFFPAIYLGCSFTFNDLKCFRSIWIYYPDPHGFF